MEEAAKNGGQVAKSVVGLMEFNGYWNQTFSYVKKDLDPEKKAATT